MENKTIPASVGLAAATLSTKSCILHVKIISETKIFELYPKVSLSDNRGNNHGGDCMGRFSVEQYLSHMLVPIYHGPI